MDKFNKDSAKENFATVMRESRVILDSDPDSDFESNASNTPASSKNSNASNFDNENGEDNTVESETEDLQFLNQSQKVSIVEESSDEESEENSNFQPFYPPKRQSIYDNTRDDSVTSSPILPIKKKKKKINFISSDSEEESINSNNNEQKPSNYSTKVPLKSKKPLSKQVDENAVLTKSTTDNEADKEEIDWVNKEIGKESQKRNDSSDENNTSLKKVHFKNVISSDRDDSFHEDYNDSAVGSSSSENNLTQTQPKELDTKNINELKLEDIPKVPATTFTTDNMGIRALETLNKQQALTQQRLQQLHGSLTTRPSEDDKAPDPAGLKIPLMPHQQHALAWLQWREGQKPRGGILGTNKSLMYTLGTSILRPRTHLNAWVQGRRIEMLTDDMGLGKTLTMISLIIATNNEKRGTGSNSDESSDDEWHSKNKNKHKRYYGNTLVICPASLLKQWEGEVKNRCQKNLLTTRIFHGNNRNDKPKSLSKCDIVITTYQTLVREADEESNFYKLEWRRIILDEAHYIKNHKSKACQSVCGLSGKYRWALTGTPIQNAEKDLFGILKFLKCSPFDDLKVWNRWVGNKNDAGKQRIITLMKSLMLRRTKQELSAKDSLLSLPEKNLQIIEVHLDPEENLVYQKILLYSRDLFAQFLYQRAEKDQMQELYGRGYNKLSSYGQNTNFTTAQKALLARHHEVESYEILLLILRLRQICCHPALIHAMLDKQDAEVNDLADVNVNPQLQNAMSNMSIHDVDQIKDKQVYDYNLDERVAGNLLTKSNPVFEDQRQSSKVRSVLEIIKKILNKGDKIIVVSQWTSLLKVIAKFLDDVDDACYEMFTGEVAVKNRQEIVDRLNDPEEDLNILLLSLTAGGVGLNLVGANHLLLLDLHWNPQLEAQAQDRIYRFGQNKRVHIYKFICKDTIEEQIKNLQDKKVDVANHVLTGSRTVSKLSIDDLNMLFS